MSQFKYKFEKYDFKRYLLDSDLERHKSEKFIFWWGRIPIPDDLIFKLFEDRGQTISLYLDHVITMMLIVLTPEKLGGSSSSLSKYPSTEFLNTINFEDIEATYKKHLVKIKDIEDQISQILLLDGYNCNLDKIRQCIAHSGKKYNRIFLPIEIRDILVKHYPHFDYSSFKAQSDMFGNAVADHYNIYRSGFSDALSGIFNKLIEFLISGFNHSEGKSIRAPGLLQVKALSSDSNKNKIYKMEKEILDGSLWEPGYIENNLGFFFDVKDFPESFNVSELYLYIFQVLSELEFSAYNEKDRKKLEYLRKDISRLIKSKIETNY